MSLPICPNCKGRAVHPDQFSAGHNVCACGHRAPVAEFHKPSTIEFVKPSGDLLDTLRIIDDARQAVYRATGIPGFAKHRTVNITETPVPHHAPVKHWSDK